MMVLIMIMKLYGVNLKNICNIKVFDTPLDQQASQLPQHWSFHMLTFFLCVRQ